METKSIEDPNKIRQLFEEMKVKYKDLEHPEQTQKIPIEFIENNLEGIYKKYDKSQDNIIDIRELYNIIVDVFEML